MGERKDLEVYSTAIRTASGETLDRQDEVPKATLDKKTSSSPLNARMGINQTSSCACTFGGRYKLMWHLESTLVHCDWREGRTWTATARRSWSGSVGGMSIRWSANKRLKFSGFLSDVIVTVLCIMETLINHFITFMISFIM